MNRPACVLSTAAVCAMALCVGAQPAAPAAQPAEAPAHDHAHEHPGAEHPGPEHELLRSLTGFWNVSARIKAGPAAEPVTISFQSRVTSVMDGMFIAEDARSEVDGRSTAELTYYGFNTKTQRYQAVFMASGVSAPAVLEGGFEAFASRYSFMGAHRWAIDGVITDARVRIEIRVLGNDQFRRDVFVAPLDAMGNPGEEFHAVEAQYVRRAPDQADPNAVRNLLPLMGQWAITVERFVQNAPPGEQPQSFELRSTINPMIGGRFMREEVMSDDGEIRGIFTLGYDAVRNRYIAASFAPGGVGMTTLRGSFDPATRAFTLTGPDVSELDRLKTDDNFRLVLTIVSDTQLKWEWYRARPGQPEFKYLQLTHTKQ